MQRGEETKLLPPHMLRLTHGSGYSGQYGTDLIYNTQDQSIIEWCSVGSGLDEWESAPSRPAEKVLDEIIEKFESLEWIPFFDVDDSEEPPSRTIIEDPVLFLRKHGEVLGFIRPLFDSSAAIQDMNASHHEDVGDDLRRRINHWRAFQKMYRDCGWGGGRFDGEAFERKRLGFTRPFNELESAEQDAQRQRRRPNAQLPMTAQEPMGQEERVRWEDAVERLDKFLVDAAGENAV